LTKGKAIAYAYSDKEKDDALKEMPEANVQRYKGLGEMNPEELKETTMEVRNRVLKRVTIEDAEGADRIFDILMGTDVASRKSFIQSNAKLATLDI
jgi:DNA gyrase subunit B